MAAINKLNGDPSGRIDKLIRSAVGQDKNAFKELCEMISGKMYSLCLRYTGIEHNAYEAFQDGVKRLYASLYAYNGAVSFETWVRKIFVLSCIDCVKKKEMVSYPDISESNILYTAVLRGDDTIPAATLHSMIQQLPTPYRLIANLCLVEGYEPGEVSAMLGIPELTGKHLLAQVTTLLGRKIILMQSNMAGSH